jgi:hypothetical protein
MIVIKSIRFFLQRNTYRPYPIYGLPNDGSSPFKEESPQGEVVNKKKNQRNLFVYNHLAFQALLLEKEES